MGVLLALIPAFCWGVQPLIARKVGGGPAEQIFGTGLGALLIGLIVQVLVGSVHGTAFLISFLAGLLWSIGQIGQFIGFTKIGVTKTMPISTGLQIIGTSLIGVLIFGEWSGVTAHAVGLLSIILIIIGVTLTAITSKSGSTTHTHLGQAIAILLPTNIGYLAYSALPKLLTAPGIQLFFPEMLGIFIGALTYNLIKTHGHSFYHRQCWQNSLIGLIFGSASLVYLVAAQSAGVATAFVITQLNVVVATLGAMLILHETKTGRELKFTLSGLGLIIIGSILTATI